MRVEGQQYDNCKRLHTIQPWLSYFWGNSAGVDNVQLLQKEIITVSKVLKDH